MRRFVPPAPTRTTFVRLLAGMAIAFALAYTSINAQIPGRNVNMVSGTSWPEGDPFLQRQNEPSIAASTRNPLHLLGGANDYRTVDIPSPDDGDVETGDAWLGLFKSFDGGQRWISGLLPGYPQDESPAGKMSPLKAYQAGADPVVRAGTHGLIYYSGLAFDRVENGKSGVFVARFIDNNNRENGDAIAYLGATMVASSTGAAFLDKPWMAVDIPRDGAAICTISANSVISTSASLQTSKGNGRRVRRGHQQLAANDGQRIPAGAVYVAYSSITGAGPTLRSEILLTRSMDCGQTWSAPLRVSRPEDPINQGANLTIDPRHGTVYVAWRRFSQAVTAQNPNPANLDAIMVARLPFGGKKVDPPGKAFGFPSAQARRVARQLENIFEHRRKTKNSNVKPAEAAEVAEFDQGSSFFSFRTNAYPVMAADGSGRVYIAWTHRGFRAHETGVGARIVVLTTFDARNFTVARAVDDAAQLGHQLMPSLAFAGGKLMLVYYDLRETKADTHGKFISDQQTLSGLRHTMDIRAAMADPGDYPGFAPSVKVSEYLMGFNPKVPAYQPLQVNPPNLPMFRQGTTPFMGDYIDIAAAPVFVPAGHGEWAYNTADTGRSPVFHAAWTDNRDVRPPVFGDWTKYTPVKMTKNEIDRKSVLDGTVVPACEPGNAGSRNQNVYSARITGGLLAGSPGNAKPLSTTLQRAFVVFATNATDESRRFRMSIRNQPVGGRASFEQFAADQPPLILLEMSVPRRSTASRTVYATSSDPDATILVDVTETTPPGPNGEEVSLSLSSTIVLNPDIENPDIENPDIENPDIENTELYNPDIENPDIENPDIENPDIENVQLSNPDIENPDIENPDIENPDIENVLVANPDIENPSILNPDIANPDIENPDIENPDIENPDIENGSIADVTWTVSNTGNTTAAFNVNLFVAQQTLPEGVKTQLILFKTYRTPVGAPNGCQLGFQTRNVLVSNILNPTFIFETTEVIPDQNDPSDKNASIWLAPGEEGRITLRIIHDDLPPNFTFISEDGTEKTVRIDPAFTPLSGLTPSISSQGVGTEDIADGKTDPELVTPTGSNLFFLQMPTNTVLGQVIAPAVRVQVRDNLTGTPVAFAEVKLKLGNNPDNATLAGNDATADGNGIASFPALSVSTAGSGYTLVASVTTEGVTASAESTPFHVVAAVVLVNATLLDAIVGSPYPPSPQALQVTGGQAPFTFAMDPNAKVDVNGDGILEPAILPPGLTLNVDTGIISGTPGDVGNYAFRVIVTDAAGDTAAANFCIHVDPTADAILITTDLTEDGTATTLAKSLLDPDEAGVSVANATTKGSLTAIGSFSGGGSATLGVGFDRGILLSSGSIAGAKGPNDNPSHSTAFNTDGDEDLRKLAIIGPLDNPISNDAAILEFDFTPTCPPGLTTCNVTFEYVFGSDEYHEFANSSFNDVFGFFLTDTTTGDIRNYAVLPNVAPETPVSINTVNGGNPLGTDAKHPEFFRSNTANPAPYNLQADGLTTPLLFNAPVHSGTTYRIKIGISDIGDSIYDSWVFIKNESFKVTHICPIIVQ